MLQRTNELPATTAPFDDQKTAKIVGLGLNVGVRFKPPIVSRRTKSCMVVIMQEGKHRAVMEHQETVLKADLQAWNTNQKAIAFSPTSNAASRLQTGHCNRLRQGHYIHPMNSSCLKKISSTQIYSGAIKLEVEILH